jgi:hypothetical protein
MVASSAYLGFLGLGLEESGSFGRTHLHVVSGGIKCERRLKELEHRALGVVGVNGASSYGVMLAST